MIDVPPAVTWLIVCLACIALGYALGVRAVTDYLTMAPAERRHIWKQGCRGW